MIESAGGEPKAPLLAQRPSDKPRSRHNLCTLFSKDTPCNICKMTEQTVPDGRIDLRCAEMALRFRPNWEKFMTDDHIVCQEQQRRRHDTKFATVLAALTTTRNNIFFSFLDFIGACEGSRWSHDKSTPFRSEANGIVETAVRRVKRRNSISSGAICPECWRSEGIEGHCYLRKCSRFSGRRTDTV